MLRRSRPVEPAPDPPVDRGRCNGPGPWFVSPLEGERSPSPPAPRADGQTSHDDTSGRDDDAMNERIHACLDGTLSRSELTAREQKELKDLEATIAESLSGVRDAPLPDLAPAILARIGESASSASGREASDSAQSSLLGELTAWLWRPRTVRIRPAWALAAAGALLLAIGVGVSSLKPGLAGPGADVAAGPDGAPVLYVRFELESTGASSVALAGTFSDWKPRYELAETAPGRWTTLVPLRPGVHEYAFVVDGERWVADPGAPRVRDGFGGVNSQISLLPPPEGGRGGGAL